MEKFEQLTFNNTNRIFVGNTLFSSKFDILYNFLLLEHSIDLFTPKELLLNIKNQLRLKTSLVFLSGSDILAYLNKLDQEKFKKYYREDYQLYILYCDPINEIQNFSWKYKNNILNFFKQNPHCPASRFYNDNLSIIVLNSKKISLNDNGNELELQLDHELNHIFDKLSNTKVPDLNLQIKNEVLNYFHKYHIVNYDIDSDDFSIHMFNSSEFYEMLCNLCNVLSFYFENNKFEIYQKLMSMLTDEYIQSEDFKQLNEPVQGSIIFAYICKKYSPERWNRTIKAVKTQLDLTGFSNNLKLVLIQLKENILNFFKKKKNA